jgi:hypothetical protein
MKYVGYVAQTGGNINAHTILIENLKRRDCFEK